MQAAERDVLAVRARMLELALPLHREAFPAHRDHADLSGVDRENAVIGEVLARIAERHSTREAFLDDARKDLDEARSFVAEKKFLTLPTRANLKVIPTPEFMRGSYPVGGFNPAPALQPELGAFYWVTPIPPDWPKERVESKLREYNFYKLKLLTIHEAMPGHYVQFEIANTVQPELAAPAAFRLRQRALHRGLGPVRHPDDARRGLPEQVARTGPHFRQGGTARVWPTPSSTSACRCSI